jgi:cytochrome c peroxidase
MASELSRVSYSRPVLDSLASALQDMYSQWSDSLARSGNRLHIALNVPSAAHLPARSASWLEIAPDAREARMHLREVSALDVWLIDRSDQPHRSALVSEQDHTLLMSGEFTRIPDDFEVDTAIAVSRGASPFAPPALVGSPGLFERMRMRRVAASDAAPLSDSSGAREASPPAPETTKLRALIAEGERLFFEEKFDGNGRTCGTCHPRANNLTIDPVFIADLPDSDPLFVSETVPELVGLDDPRLLRTRGLIGLKLDGLENPVVFHGVLHLFGLSQTITPPDVPLDSIEDGGRMPPIERVGISADLNIAPVVTLRDVATPAVLAFATRNQERVPDRDFRLPDDAELDAIEAFMLTLGRQEERALDRIRLADPQAEIGRRLFLATDTEGGKQRAAKCGICHANAGANVDVGFFKTKFGLSLAANSNANFTTGVNELPNSPLQVLTRDNPVLRDGGFGVKPLGPDRCRFSDGRPGAGGFGVITEKRTPLGLAPGLCLEDFNVPSLIEAADTPPFFHDNAVDTLEAAVAFYAGAAFKGSAAAQVLRSADSAGRDIDLDATEIEAVAKFLRVLNADENLRQVATLDETADAGSGASVREVLRRMAVELEDAREVLAASQLNPVAVRRLSALRELVRESATRPLPRVGAQLRFAAIEREVESIRASLIQRRR